MKGGAVWFLILCAAFISGSGGFAIGLKVGREDERVAQQETRDYVNDSMSKAGFCRGTILGSLVESCLTKENGR